MPRLRTKTQAAFAATIRAERAARALKQEELSALCKRYESWINKLEKNRLKPMLDDVEVVARGLGLTEEQFLRLYLARKRRR